MGADETRGAIVRESVRLFTERGYENTAVQAIIDSVGVSKGAFYHHFASKEGVVEEITEDYIAEGLERMHAVTGEEGLSTVEKLNRLIETTHVYKAQRQDTREAMEQAFADDRNSKLEKAIVSRLRAGTVPLFTRILEEGISRGELQIAGAELHAEILFQLLLGMKELLREKRRAGTDPDTVNGILSVYADAVCRLLTLPGGAIRLRSR